MVDLLAFQKLLLSFFPLFRIDIQKCQKLMSSHKFRIQRQNLFQLDHCNIQSILLTACQCLIVTLNGSVNGIQSGLVVLNHIDIVFRNVLFRTKVGADDPFTEGSHHFSRFKINQTQKVSGFHMVFIKFQALTQTGNCT